MEEICLKPNQSSPPPEPEEAVTRPSTANATGERIAPSHHRESDSFSVGSSDGKVWPAHFQQESKESSCCSPHCSHVHICYSGSPASSIYMSCSLSPGFRSLIPFTSSDTSNAGGRLSTGIRAASPLNDVCRQASASPPRCGSREARADNRPCDRSVLVHSILPRRRAQPGFATRRVLPPRGGPCGV